MGSMSATYGKYECYIWEGWVLHMGRLSATYGKYECYIWEG